MAKKNLTRAYTLSFMKRFKTTWERGDRGKALKQISDLRRAYVVPPLFRRLFTEAERVLRTVVREQAHR